jgi:FtsZ-binding cell division protein ZapB
LRENDNSLRVLQEKLAEKVKENSNFNTTLNSLKTSSEKLQKDNSELSKKAKKLESENKKLSAENEGFKKQSKNHGSITTTFVIVLIVTFIAIPISYFGLKFYKKSLENLKFNRMENSSAANN